MPGLPLPTRTRVTPPRSIPRSVFTQQKFASERLPYTCDQQQAALTKESVLAAEGEQLPLYTWPFANTKREQYSSQALDQRSGMSPPPASAAAGSIVYNKGGQRLQCQ